MPKFCQFPFNDFWSPSIVYVRWSLQGHRGAGDYLQAGYTQPGDPFKYETFKEPQTERFMNLRLAGLKICKKKQNTEYTGSAAAEMKKNKKQWLHFQTCNTHDWLINFNLIYRLGCFFYFLIEYILLCSYTSSYYLCLWGYVFARICLFVS